MVSRGRQDWEKRLRGRRRKGLREIPTLLESLRSKYSPPSSPSLGDLSEPLRFRGTWFHLAIPFRPPTRNFQLLPILQRAFLETFLDSPAKNSVLSVLLGTPPRCSRGLPGGSSDKEFAYQCRRHRQETPVRSLSQEDPLKEEMVTHCSILAWGNLMDRGV